MQETSFNLNIFKIILCCFLFCVYQVKAFEIIDGVKAYKLTATSEPQLRHHKKVQQFYIEQLDREVLIANKTIVVSTKPLFICKSLESENHYISCLNDTNFPQISSISLIHKFKGNYVYFVDTDNVEQAISLAEKFNNTEFVRSAQPDMLFYKSRHSQVSFFNKAVQSPPESFDLHAYLGFDKKLISLNLNNIRVAVIDSGFDLSHPQLAHINPVFSWDVDYELPKAIADLSLHKSAAFHGSRVAGLLWAKRISNGQMSGQVQDTQSILIKQTKLWSSNLWRAFTLSEKHHADVINISWLQPYLVRPLAQYLEYLITDSNEGKGIVIVTADAHLKPNNRGLERLENALVVTSHGHNFKPVSFYWHEQTDVASPSYIYSVSFNSQKQKERFLTVSASVPITTAVIAVIKATCPELSAVQLANLLKKTTKKRFDFDVPQGFKVFDPIKIKQVLSKRACNT